MNGQQQQVIWPVTQNLKMTKTQQKGETQRGVILLPPDGMLVHHRMSSMKQWGVMLLPPGWDAGPSQDTQQEATMSNVTAPPPPPPGWDAGPSQDIKHVATRSIATPLH